jgi:hypothetical protein
MRAAPGAFAAEPHRVGRYGRLHMRLDTLNDRFLR